METSQQSANKSLVIGIIVIGVLIGTAIAFWLMPAKEEPVAVEPVVEEVVAAPEPVVEPEPEPVVEAPVIEEPVAVEPEVVAEEVAIEDIKEEIVLPELDNSDKSIQEKLYSLTWRKELLKLVIDEDMVRRFVVFTDNFASGKIVYEHSPLVEPDSAFSAIETEQDVWSWDTNSSKRFNLYLELLQSLEAEQLVNWYYEVKPLVDQAYGELGYPDSDFTETLKLAIERVIDMNTPSGEILLERPSVMFKYKDAHMEKLPEADKLLLRIGKSNLLVLKSLLIKIDEQLDKQS